MRENERDFIYGRWPVEEALRLKKVKKVYVAEGLEKERIDEIRKLAQRVPCFVETKSRRELDRLVGPHNQGLAAVIERIEGASLDSLLATVKTPRNGPHLLFLDGVEDPQNLGSIIRSAFYFGVIGVVIPRHRAAPLTGAVVKASAGAAHVLPICQVANLATAIESAKSEGFWIVGADMDGQNVKKADVPRPFCLVLGGEGQGLHDLVKKKCDMIVGLERLAKGESVQSLNVGVACGAFLHHFS